MGVCVSELQFVFFFFFLSLESRWATHIFLFCVLINFPQLQRCIILVAIQSYPSNGNRVMVSTTIAITASEMAIVSIVSLLITVDRLFLVKSFISFGKFERFNWESKWHKQNKKKQTHNDINGSCWKIFCSLPGIIQSINNKYQTIFFCLPNIIMHIDDHSNVQKKKINFGKQTNDIA